MDGNLILSIETATSCGSVSLTRGHGECFQLLAECMSQPDVTHSRRLFGSIDWLMKTSGVGWNDLDAIAISLGPGSFTGLRIGMAAAKAIAMAGNKPLLGVPTLDALALNNNCRGSLTGCLLDARKQQVYAGFYRSDEGGQPRPVNDPVAIDPEALSREIDEPVFLIGSGARLYSQILGKNALVTLGADYLSVPRASLVGQVAGEMFASGHVLDPASAAPMYVRASEAEVNLKKKNNAG